MPRKFDKNFWGVFFFEDTEDLYHCNDLNIFIAHLKSLF